MAPGSRQRICRIFLSGFIVAKNLARAAGMERLWARVSIAYWIVRNHGGQIEVSSKEAGGTTFCVWLPLAEKDCQEE